MNPLAPSFSEYVSKYANKKNPSTGKVWTSAEISTDSSIMDRIIDEWQRLIKDTNDTFIINEGRAATDSELNAAYQLIHPKQHPIASAFGPYYVADDVLPSMDLNKKFGELTVAEAIEILKSVEK